MIEVAPGIYRGSTVKANEFHKLYTAGIKTILNLQLSDQQESQWQCYLLGMTQIDFGWPPLFPPDEQMVKRCLVIMSNPRMQPIYVHCRAGVDRTGFIVANYRIRCQQWPKQLAIAEMFAMGMHWYYRWWKEYL